MRLFADALRQGIGGSFNCVREVFSGIPAYCVGPVYDGNKPAYGEDMDEKAAANQPDSYREIARTQCRMPDRALLAPGFFKGNSFIELFCYYGSKYNTCMKQVLCGLDDCL